MDHYWDYYFGFAGQANHLCPVVVEGGGGRFEAPRSYHEYVDDLLTRKALGWLAQPHARPFCRLTIRGDAAVEYLDAFAGVPAVSS